MKPMVPTFDEARELALTLCNERGMTAMQRAAAAGILNFLERSAGPDLKAGKRLLVNLEARLAAYEKAVP